MTPQEEENLQKENLKKRIDRHNKTKEETPVFSFMQEITFSEWFYKWYKWKVYKEIDFTLHPDQANNKDDGVVTSYEVIIYDDKDAVIDRRVIEAKYMSA